MVAQSSDVANSLIADRIEKFRPGGITSTTKHEISPDENTKLVAEIVEHIFLIDSTAPDPEPD
jgi:glycerol-3-phosphate responsive antiterminator